MYRSLLLLAISISYCGQLLAQDVNSSDPRPLEHDIQLTEILLTDDGLDALEPEEIAANVGKYLRDGKLEIVQMLGLTVLDGRNTTLVQSKPVDLKGQVWIGSIVRLSAKANDPSIRIGLEYVHTFVPNLSPDSEKVDGVLTKADKTLELINTDPVAINLEDRNFDREVNPTGSKRYLVVAIKSNDEQVRRTIGK